jgi:release factor glutamine methyltransferase
VVRDHEPRRALSPGPDALLVHRRIAAGAATWLRPGGRLILEIGAGQDEALRRLYAEAAGFEECLVQKDLAGIPRVLSARRPA